MIERIKGRIAFLCDIDGCHEGLETETGDFRTASDEAKEAGWQFRNRDGEWKHYCSAQHEQMGFNGQSITREASAT